MIYYKLPSQLERHHKKTSHGNLNAQQCFLEVMLLHSNHFVIFYQMTTQLIHWHLLRYLKFPMVRKMTAIEKEVNVLYSKYLKHYSHLE